MLGDGIKMVVTRNKKRKVIIMLKLKKAVFPVAGFGTRFLPVTKAMPKELLPIVDKPLIQYAAEEAIAAGINTLIFVTGRNKRAIEDHFDANIELETMLRAAKIYRPIWCAILFRRCRMHFRASGGTTGLRTCGFMRGTCSRRGSICRAAS